jgi:hypothetical protein
MFKDTKDIMYSTLPTIILKVLSSERQASSVTNVRPNSAVTNGHHPAHITRSQEGFPTGNATGLAGCGASTVVKYISDRSCARNILRLRSAAHRPCLLRCNHRRSAIETLIDNPNDHGGRGVEVNECDVVTNLRTSTRRSPVHEYAGRTPLEPGTAKSRHVFKCSV